MLERLATLWAAVTVVLEIQLFSIGDTAVTPVGLVRVLLVVGAATLISRAVRGTLDRVSTRWPGTDRASLYTLGRVAHYVLLAIGISIGLSTIGVDFTNLAVLLGALGIGIGFGLQDTVANFIAGLVILALAHPLLNPGGGMPGIGPVLLVVDDGWAAARDWPARRRAAARTRTSG